MELDFQNYPKFTPEMKKTHKILIPNMAPVQFRILAAVMEQAGYTCELLENCGSQVSELGLKYVHNDTCYPALLVIGQFLDALASGKYDLDHTALIITQTGGGCRASNYIHLLRKALVKAGYGQVPVVSLNFSGLEKDSGFPMTVTLMRKLLACIYYGDLLVALKAQTEPYETHKGDAAALQDKWLDTICGWVHQDKGWTGREIKAAMPKIAREFAAIPVHRTPKVKVGVVGEIYVKYSPLGNNDLEKFLASQDCEVNLPGLMGFVQYCAYNPSETARLYGGTFLEKHVSDLVLKYIEGMETVLIKVLKDNGYHAPLPFRELVKLTDGLISTGDKMGEGWLLTAEMVELVRAGYENIVCAQPFGCLPNHICGKGMINKIRELYPQANITPIDYDPSATRVNQENRIKLMLAVGRERLPAQAAHGGSAPQPAARPARFAGAPGASGSRRMSRALVLMGSPRKTGNTAALLAPFCQALEDGGMETETVWLKDLHIEPCVACRACQKDWTAFVCSRRDDFAPVAEKVLAADLLVLATPIYSWFCTPPMKAALDRLVYGMNKYYGDYGAKRGPSLWKGKALALLMTCGYRPEQGCDLFTEAVQRYGKHSRLRYLGAHAERHLGYDIPFMDEEKAARTRAFAQTLLDSL